MLEYERREWSRGLIRLAGVDEAGRGCLAGPVVAAAVVFGSDDAERLYAGILAGLTDSKQLRADRREHYFRILTSTPGVEIGLGSAGNEEIDRVNILRATHLAMARALSNLRTAPELALVDGLPVAGLPCESNAIVDGDAKSLLIAAASVVAKVVRDGMIRELDLVYPGYGFAEHKGYGCRSHVQALFERGPSPVHRRSFRPVAEAEGIRKASQLRLAGLDAAGFRGR